MVGESVSAKGDVDRYFHADEPGSYYSVRSGISGFAPPFAVGMQLAHPNRRVVCLSATARCNIRSRLCGPRSNTTFL
jgi:benzoylformate decarboxylase